MTAADWNADIGGPATPGGTDTIELPARPDDANDMTGVIGYVALTPRCFILPDGMATFDDMIDAELLALLDQIHPDLRYWWLGLKWSVLHLEGKGLDNSNFVYHPPNRIQTRFDERPNKRNYGFLHKWVCIKIDNPDHTSGPVADLKTHFLKAKDDSLSYCIGRNPGRVDEIMASYTTKPAPAVSATGLSPSDTNQIIRLVDGRTEREATQKALLFKRHKTTYQLIGCKVSEMPGGNYKITLGNPSAQLCECWESNALPMDQQIQRMQKHYTSYTSKTAKSMNMIVMVANKDEERMTREMTAALKSAMFATTTWSKAADNKNKIFIGVFVPIDQNSTEYKAMVEKNKIRSREAALADNRQASRKANEGMNLYVAKNFLDHNDLLKTLATFMFDLGFWLETTNDDDIHTDSLLAMDLVNIFKRINSNNVGQ